MTTFLRATNDVAFKKLFGDQGKKDVLIDFLNNILGRAEGEKIIQVTYNDPYNLPETRGSKLSIVDVSATDQDGKNYIIEVQVGNQQDYGARAQYYSSLAVARQLDWSDEYARLKPVIFVGVLGFELFKGNKDYLSHHFVLEEKTQRNDLRLMEWHFIELTKFTKTLEVLETVVDKWIFLLKDAWRLHDIPEQMQSSIALKKAFGILNKATWSDQELYEYDKERDAIMSEKSKMDTAKAEGKAEGQKEMAYQIAQQLFGRFDEEEISKTTGLSIEEIQALKKK